MGDAGPRILDPPIENPQIESQTPENAVRDIHVLVTGFGAFKSFTNNPSYLIASSLPKHLDPLPPESAKVSTTPAPVPTPPTQQHPLVALLGRPTILLPYPKPSASSSNPPPPHPHNTTLQPIRRPNPHPYRIHIHSFPSPLYVAYAPTSTLIPSLLDPHTNAPFHIDFDYILHIGLASGRDSYTLETNAHRDEYDIKDVDDQEGYLPGEKVWKSLAPPIPERLDVGWLPSDVLAKWEAEVERRQDITERGIVAGAGLDRMLDEMARGDLSAREELLTNLHGSLKERLIGGAGGRHSRDIGHVRRPRRAVVKLSRDAGRYLCEFILMCSLVYRYRDARGDFEPQSAEEEVTNAPSRRPRTRTRASANADAAGKIGKVAFLHVPNGTEPEDIERGKMVAESAIQALVASWEAGFRNPLVYSRFQDPMDRAKLWVMGEDGHAPSQPLSLQPLQLPPLTLTSSIGAERSVVTQDRQQREHQLFPIRTRDEFDPTAIENSGFETRATGDS